MTTRLQPDSERFPVVGIVGAGPLARLMIQAAIPLGIGVRVLAERADDPAALVCPNVDIGMPNNARHLREFAARCDVVTFDHELVYLDALAEIEAGGGIVRPGAQALRYARDRLYQRTEFKRAGLPVPEFAEAPHFPAIDEFVQRHGWPVVVKSQQGGYDGHGVWVLEDANEARDFFDATAGTGVDLMLERWVRIDRELAVLVARRPGGESVTYPVVETVQRGGICHEVIAPAPVTPEIAARARLLGEQIAELTQAVGVIAIEMFLVGDELLINEVATRPHHSGHFSIEGCATSQFDNHLRAVLDWPLGPTDLLAPFAVMANLLGEGRDSLAPRIPRALAAGPPSARWGGVHPHLYGAEALLGRKMGHVTALGDDLEETRARAAQAAALLTGRAT